MYDIKQVFHKKKALMAFITGGDPDIQTTKELVIALANAGADIIGIRIPFSDPVAQGLDMQAADKRALNTGTTAQSVFELAPIYQQVNVPVVVMTYANPIFVYGLEKFVADCNASKISAIIVQDLPNEEKNELKPYCTAHNINLISIVVPISQERAKKIAKEAEGFLYCLLPEQTPNQAELISQLRSSTDIPIAISADISSPNMAKELGSMADGIIINDKIAKIIAEHGADCVPHVCDFIKTIKESLNSL